MEHSRALAEHPMPSLEGPRIVRLDPPSTAEPCPGEISCPQPALDGFRMHQPVVRELLWGDVGGKPRLEVVDRREWLATAWHLCGPHQFQHIINTRDDSGFSWPHR